MAQGTAAAAPIQKMEIEEVDGEDIQVDREPVPSEVAPQRKKWNLPESREMIKRIETEELGDL